MTDRHDHPPDPAALDELRTAFGVPAEPADEPEPEIERESEPEIGPDEPDEPDALFVVEQTPPDEPPDTPEPSGPPTIVRIDDLTGSVRVWNAEAPDDLADTPAAGSDRDSGRDVDREVEQGSGSVDVGQPVEVVVIADDDELPDAVYVEGSLDRSTERSIVFIEDDDAGDALVPDLDRDGRRGIEPRLRERRVAVKRAQSRKRLKWVALGVGVVFVVVGGLALLGSPLFAVRAGQVRVTGNVYTDPVRLEEIVDDLVGTPALRVDTERLERELEAISWVDDARVRVDFPHAATIEIRERAAMTTYQGPDGRFRVLDREGRVLDVIDKYPFAYLLIEGPDPTDLDQGEFAPSGYAAASELAKNLTASVRGRVEYVDVTADGSRLVLHLDDGSAVFFGEARDLFAKLLRLETVLTANPDREPGPIDVSTDDVTL